MEETLKLYLTTQRRKKLIVRRSQMPGCRNGSGSGGGGVDHLFFGTGSQVEVSSDDEGFRGSWYVATIIDIDYNAPLPSSTSNKKKRKTETRYLVEYATLLNDDGGGGGEEMSKKPLRERVDASFMRPLPPPTENQHTYELNDVVDAFHRDGWWTGVVKRVVDGGSKFVVFFQNPPEEVEFARLELRVHHDWVDCKWVRAEKKSDCTFGMAAMSVKELEGESIKGSGTKNPQRLPGKSSVKCMKSKKKNVIDQQRRNVKEIIEPKTEEIIEPKSEVSSHHRKRGRPKKVVIESPTGLANGEEKNGAQGASFEMVVKDCARNDAEESTVAGVCLQGIRSLNHGYPSQLPQRQYNIMDNMLDCRLTKIDNQISETIGEKSGRKAKSCISKRRTQRRSTNTKSPTQDSQGRCGEKSSERFEDRPQLMWYEGTNSPTTVDDSKIPDTCIEKASKEIEDQPQLMWRDGMNSPSTVDDSRLSLDLNVVQNDDASDRQEESALQSPAIASSYKNVSQKDKNSPFEKRSPIWGTLERMEIFQKMPQQPHFSPLVTSKEDSREGLAIGNMVIFASVVEKTSILQFSDPRSIIDSSLETLSDLETHGFDVDLVRRRLNELLLKKEKQGQLLEESKAVEIKITEHCIEKVKIGQEIGEIKKKMEELQEKLALATSMEKMTDYEIDALTSKMGVIGQDLQNAQLDFERLAAAPL